MELPGQPIPSSSRVDRRKNYLFAGSDTGGDRAASMYMIGQPAKLNDANPEAYLHDTLTKIAEGHPINRIGEPMPWAMS